MRLNALTRCNSRFRKHPPSRPPLVQADAQSRPIVIILGVVPSLLPDLPDLGCGATVRDRNAVAGLVAEGRLSLDCAEGAFGMDDACSGFPAPETL